MDPVKQTLAALETLNEVHALMDDLPATCTEAWSKLLRGEKLLRRFFKLAEKLPLTFVARVAAGGERIVARYEIFEHGRRVQQSLKEVREHVEQRCPKKLATGLNGWV